MSDKPITNPFIPHVGPLPGVVAPGKFIRILGIASPVGKGFACNLQCGPNNFDDIALQVSVHLDQNKISVNSQELGIWNDAQNYPNSPILRGQQFEILIICEHTVFKVGVNGQHLCEFPHKVPYYRATYIRVEGDVTISHISVESQPSVPPMNGYTAATNAPPPPYPATSLQYTVPPSFNAGPPPLNSAPPPLNAVPHTIIYPPGAYSNAPLLHQPTNIAALNATPRQQFWSRPRYNYGNRKMVYIATGVATVFMIIFVIVFFTVFFKQKSEFDRHWEEAQQRQEEFHKKHFGDNW